LAEIGHERGRSRNRIAVGVGVGIEVAVAVAVAVAPLASKKAAMREAAGGWSSSARTPRWFTRSA
jgi:hypothetical protein